MDRQVPDLNNKGGRPKRGEGVRMQIRVPREVAEQIQELSKMLHISYMSVVAQAVARMYASEPLLQPQKKRKFNGDGNP
jgi:hypothetical protein